MEPSGFPATPPLSVGLFLRQRLSDGSVNKTILKPARLAAAPGRQYVYVRFSRRKIPRSSAYTILEKAIRFWHPDYNPHRAQKLISSSMSRHMTTRNILSKSMNAFLSNLANRQTDKRTRAKTSSFVGGKKHGQKHYMHLLLCTSVKFHRNLSITSSDIPLKFKNPL